MKLLPLFIALLIISIKSSATGICPTALLGKWRKSEFWPKRATAVSNQWCMPVNLLGGAILFDPWFTQYKVKGHLVQICKKRFKQIIDIMTRKTRT